MEKKKIEQIKAEWIFEKARVSSRSTTKPPFDLPEIQASRYTDPAFYELEINHVWNKVWLLAGFASELPEIGSVKLLDNLPGGPIFLTRDQQRNIRAYFNVCKHRGARLVESEDKVYKSFSCKYHGWDFSIEGLLSSVPDRPDYTENKLSNRNLVPLKCELWSSMVFVSFDPEAKPLKDFLGALITETSDLPLNDYNLYKTVTFDAPVNWKCVQEAFSETYHIRFVHPNSINQVLDPFHTARDTFPNGHGFIAVQSRIDGSNLFHSNDLLPEDPGQEITRNGQRAYNVFPNLTCVTAELFVPILSIWPNGVDRCHLRLHFLINKSVAFEQIAHFDKVIEGFKGVIDEDLQAVDGMQESLKSNGIQTIALGANEKVIYNLHEMIDALIGSRELLQHFRVEPFFHPCMWGDKKVALA